MEAELNDPMAIKCLHQVINAMRKIGDDLVFSVSNDQLAVRALNATKSALPVVTFKKTFFHSFMFKSRKDIVRQVPGKAVTTAFKNVNSPTSVKLEIEKDCFHIGLIDKFSILHDWELFLEDAVLLSAPYDLSDSTVQIQCRTDVFDGLADTFRGNQNVMLEMGGDGTIIIKSAVVDELALSSTMTIKRSDSCTMQVQDDVDQLHVSFSVADFIVAAKIAKVLNQRMSVYIVGPGMPIVIKAVIPNQVTFEMALATASDSDRVDDDPPVTTPADPEPRRVADWTPSLQGSQASQVSPWPRKALQENSGVSTGETVPFPANPVYSESDRVSGMTVVGARGMNRERMSQMIDQGLFSESPPFPIQKRMTGQYAEDSQPPSDESDSDM